MGTLYLIRHGQASFGSDDYDRLSPLGHQQCRALGDYFRARGVRFEACYRGTLRRHRESLEGIEAGLGQALPHEERTGLNEYSGEALIEALRPPVAPPARDAAHAREHFRLLRLGLAQWIDGASEPAGMPRFTDFAAGVAGVLEEVRTRHEGTVLVVSSGGPISTAVAQVLEAPPPTLIELNMRMRNSSITEFHFTAQRHALLTYNAVPHLERPGQEGERTHY
jgi:broad specificity phosphatase PhoE